MSTPQIHWHEGLFLQAHHLQLLQKHTLDQFGSERKLAMNYGYGVIEAKLSTDALRNMQLRFEKLKVVMPGGIVLSYPENTELPSLDIRDALAASPRGFEVFLGLPHWLPARPNTIEGEVTAGARIKQIYRLRRQATQVFDENTGGNEQPLQLRHYNAMLLLEHEDRSSLDTIPLLRVVRHVIGDEAFPRPDPDYVHPCLLLSGSPTLVHLVRDITALVDAEREQLANAMARSGVSPTINPLQLEHALRLSCLNRFTARMPGLLAIGEGNSDVPPFDVYQELLTLLADLMALAPDRMPFRPIPYNHRDPYPCFRDTAALIREFMGRIGPIPYVVVDFEIRDEVTQVASLEDRHFTEPSAWYLGVKTNHEPIALAQLVTDMVRFKLLPPSYLEKVIGGIPLSEERRPPFEFPQELGRYYFRLLNESKRMAWTDARAERALALRWSKESTISDARFSLFMTLPSAT